MISFDCRVLVVLFIFFLDCANFIIYLTFYQNYLKHLQPVKYAYVILDIDLIFNFYYYLDPTFIFYKLLQNYSYI